MPFTASRLSVGLWFSLLPAPIVSLLGNYLFSFTLYLSRAFGKDFCSDEAQFFIIAALISFKCSSHREMALCITRQRPFSACSRQEEI